jgi:PIN domain nuclease of toxin-antitoxin system
MTVLLVTAAHIAYLENLSEIHRDPFGRIIARYPDTAIVRA